MTTWHAYPNLWRCSNQLPWRCMAPKIIAISWKSMRLFFSNYWELMDCLSEELFLSMSKFSWLSMIKFMNLRRPKTIQVCVDKRSTFMLFSIYQFNSYHGYLHLTNFDLSIFCLPLLNSHTHVWPCVPIVQANVPSFGCIITYNL